MQYENKELYLLIWDDKKGKFDKYILNHAMKQNTEGEHHVILGMRVGEL